MSEPDSDSHQPPPEAGDALPPSELAAALKRVLPASEHERADELARLLVRTLEQSKTHGSGDAAHALADPTVEKTLRALAGQSVAIGSSQAIDFGEGNRIGDVTLRGDVAGRDLVKIQIAYSPERPAAAPRRALELSPSSWRPWLEQKTWTQLAGAGGGTITLILAIVQILRTFAPAAPVAPPPLGPMTGDFKIGVAEFVIPPELAVDASSAALGQSLAETLSASLNDQLTQLQRQDAPDVEPYTINVKLLTGADGITGSTAQERADAAAARAATLGAQVLVYGTVQKTDVGAALLPQYYISTQSLPGAEDLSGQEEFGSPILARGALSSPEAPRSMRAALVQRTSALAEFLLGLNKFNAGDYAEALRRFMRAAGSPAWEERKGKESLYMFIGTASGRLKGLDSARGAFQHALELDPGYARASLGLAEVHFQTIRGMCQPGEVNSADMETVIQEYQQALSASDQPAHSDIPTKVEFAIGRARLCLTLAGVPDQWPEAERNLQLVVSAYDAGNPRVRELAAESHSSLGVGALPFLGDPNAAEGYHRAEVEFDKALHVSQNPKRQAYFASMLGRVHARLGDFAQAEQDYALAIALDPDNAAAYETAQRDVRANGPPA